MAIYRDACPVNPTSLIDHREPITVNINTPWQASVKYEAFTWFSTRLRSREVSIKDGVTKTIAKTLIAKLLSNLSTDNIVI